MNRKIPFVISCIAVFAACAVALRRPAQPETPSVAPNISKSTPQNEAVFDGSRAFALLKAQCDFGPRPNGSAAHEKTAAFLIEQLKPLVEESALQKWNQFVPRGPGAGHTFAMTNILGMIRGSVDKDKNLDELRPALMISAHWDTRPVADQDIDPSNRTQPIMGANDGASGVAVVLEIARALHEARPQQTIVFALWDGEDLGEFFYGARRFARLSRTTKWQNWTPQRGVLLDMIGDADLNVSGEQNSMRRAPELWNEMQGAAAELNHSANFDGATMNVLDDHIPLNDAGIPTIDLIDFDYPSWHTLQDTPDKCSAASLQIIGDVLLRFIENNGRTRA